jgi:hypothetical protein
MSPGLHMQGPRGQSQLALCGYGGIHYMIRVARRSSRPLDGRRFGFVIVVVVVDIILESETVHSIVEIQNLA